MFAKKKVDLFCCFVLVLAALCCISCKTSKPKPLRTNHQAIEVNHAKGFALFANQNETIVEIYNPWQKASNAVFTYALSKKQGIESPNPNQINVPIKRAICFSTTHLAFVEKLGHCSKVNGISGLKYVNSEKFLDQAKKGELKDIGYEQNINFELIISMAPDVVFAYSVGSENTGFLEKFGEMGIPLVFIGDYLEPTPLGKAEWIKVFGLFFNQFAKADSIFREIAEQYRFTKKLVRDIDNKPLVMTGLLWNQTWMVPGGNSYLANFLKDAGAKYIWDNNQLNRSVPISIEKILIDSREADFWIHPGNANSINDIIHLDGRLGKLNPLENNKVFNNNRLENKSGGNDYWESGAVNPHGILKDLIYIFHPSLLPGHQMKYFHKLE